MDINQVRSRKQKLSEDIEKLIEEFFQETNLKIKDVTLHYDNWWSKPLRAIEIELERI